MFDRSDIKVEGRNAVLVLKIAVAVHLILLSYNLYRGRSYRVASRVNYVQRGAGFRPSGVVNTKAIASMKETGYDLTTHRSKSLDDQPDVEWDFVATMGCGDECPFIRAKRREDWQIPDPKDLPPNEFRKVRDQIEAEVIGYLESSSWFTSNRG